jgi:hypothetical protein
LEIQGAEAQAAFHIFGHAVHVFDKVWPSFLLRSYRLCLGVLIETATRSEVLGRDQAILLLASPARTILRVTNGQDGLGLQRGGEPKNKTANQPWSVSGGTHGTATGRCASPSIRTVCFKNHSGVLIGWFVFKSTRVPFFVFKQKTGSFVYYTLVKHA